MANDNVLDPLLPGLEKAKSTPWGLEKVKSECWIAGLMPQDETACTCTKTAPCQECMERLYGWRSRQVRKQA